MTNCAKLKEEKNNRLFYFIFIYIAIQHINTNVYKHMYNSINTHKRTTPINQQKKSDTNKQTNKLSKYFPFFPFFIFVSPHTTPRSHPQPHLQAHLFSLLCREVVRAVLVVVCVLCVPSARLRLEVPRDGPARDAAADVHTAVLLQAPRKHGAVPAPGHTAHIRLVPLGGYVMGWWY